VTQQNPYRPERRATHFATLVDEMMPQLPGANAPYVRQKLHGVMEQLCAETHCWVDDTGCVDIDIGEVEYNIPVGWDAQILYVQSVQYNGRELDRRRYRVDLSDVEAPVIRLAWMPNKSEEGALRFRVALSPLPMCENFPDGLLATLRRALKAGALYEMEIEAGKPYSNPQMAMRHLQGYNDAKTEINSGIAHNGTAGELNVHGAMRGLVL